LKSKTGVGHLVNLTLSVKFSMQM